MMKVYILLLMATVALFSCKENLTKQNQELIIGDWYPLDIGYVPENQIGYQFTKENLCINKTGFYSYFYPDGTRLGHYGSGINDSAWFCDYHGQNDFPFGFDPLLYNINRAYGNKTTYLINEDTLEIFDPAKEKWMKYHIQFQGQDTLKLTYWYEDFKYNTTDWFTRTSFHERDSAFKIDQLIFCISASCYTGEKYLLIRRDGLFFSYGYYKTDEFFIARMQPREFERIETLFKQSNITEIVDSFQSIGYFPTFDSFITLVNIDHEMSTIENPIGRTPNEFQWAYLSGVFLPDVIKELKPYYENEHPPLLTQMGDFRNIIIRGRNGRILYMPERFYLGVLLCYAKQVKNVAFEPKYNLSLIPDKRAFMQTDGRYFRYINNEGKEITLDIGFNFIEVNRLDQANQ